MIETILIVLMGIMVVGSFVYSIYDFTHEV